MFFRTGELASLWPFDLANGVGVYSLTDDGRYGS